MSAPRKVILSGATGLVGKAVARQLAALGYEVVPFRSRHDGAGGMNHLTGHIDRDALEGAFAVIHLAGEPISQRWSAAAKERILTSRRDGTRLLAETLAGLKTKPELFLSMSGVGRYGIRRTETLTEASTVSTEGFLGESPPPGNRRPNPPARPASGRLGSGPGSCSRRRAVPCA